jgi:hypothetical protein
MANSWARSGRWNFWAERRGVWEKRQKLEIHQGQEGEPLSQWSREVELATWGDVVPEVVGIPLE